MLKLHLVRLSGCWSFGGFPSRLLERPDAAVSDHRRKRGGTAKTSLLLLCLAGLTVFLAASAFVARYVRDDTLFTAAESGNARAVRGLLLLGATPNPKDFKGDRALNVAAAGGHIGVLRVLLGAEVSIEERDDMGNTPLMSAARNGRDATVAWLIARGAEVNAKTVAADTALILAAERGRPETVAVLLAHGADVAVRTQEGKTALDYARANQSKRFFEGIEPEKVKAARQRELQTVRLLQQAMRRRRETTLRKASDGRP